jgi:hypothetical protein
MYLLNRKLGGLKGLSGPYEEKNSLEPARKRTAGNERVKINH